MTTPRRRALVLAAAALVVAAAVAVLLVRGGAAPAGGSLYSPDADEVTGSVRPGTPFTWGNPTYLNKGESPLTLISARPVPLAAGLRVDRVVVAGPERKVGAVGFDRRFPPRIEVGRLRPIEGATVVPQRRPGGKIGIEILFGMTATRPGRYVVKGVEVTYREGDSEHVETLPDALGVCAVEPPASVLADCPFPGRPRGEVG